MLATRLERLLETTDVLERRLAGHVDGDAPPLPTATDVVVLGLSPEGAVALDVLRALRRRHPALRIVVVGSSTAHFEEAFDAGADAWVGAEAGDGTLLMAIDGRWSPRVTGDTSS